MSKCFFKISSTIIFIAKQEGKISAEHSPGASRVKSSDVAALAHWQPWSRQLHRPGQETFGKHGLWEYIVLGSAEFTHIAPPKIKESLEAYSHCCTKMLWSLLPRHRKMTVSVINRVLSEWLQKTNKWSTKTSTASSKTHLEAALLEGSSPTHPATGRRFAMSCPPYAAISTFPALRQHQRWNGTRPRWPDRTVQKDSLERIFESGKVEFLSQRWFVEGVLAPTCRCFSRYQYQNMTTKTKPNFFRNFFHEVTCQSMISKQTSHSWWPQWTKSKAKGKETQKSNKTVANYNPDFSSCCFSTSSLSSKIHDDKSLDHSLVPILRLIQLPSLVEIPPVIPEKYSTKQNSQKYFAPKIDSQQKDSRKIICQKKHLTENHSPTKIPRK